MLVERDLSRSSSSIPCLNLSTSKQLSLLHSLSQQPAAMLGYPLQEPSNFRDYVAIKGGNWRIYYQESSDTFVNRTQCPWINIQYKTADLASRISVKEGPLKALFMKMLIIYSKHKQGHAFF